LKFNKNTKIVYRVHDFFPITNPEWFKLNQKISFKLGIQNSNPNDYYLFNSTFTSEMASLFKKFKKFQILSCPTFFLDSSPCRRCIICLKGLPVGKYALTIGTLEPRKNYTALLNSWISVFKVVKIPLIVVGNPGWKESNISESSEIIHISNLCEFGLNLLYSKTIVYVAPSLSEGFDIPAVRAKKYNCFVLASDIPVHREILGNDIRVKYIPSSFDQIWHRRIIEFVRNIKPIDQSFNNTLEMNIWSDEFQKSINSIISKYS
jgi:glycosyltransferase involved in cell wall biosynthesis